MTCMECQEGLLILLCGGGCCWIVGCSARGRDGGGGYQNGRCRGRLEHAPSRHGRLGWRPCCCETSGKDHLHSY